MLEKIKNLFKEKDDKKKMENLIVFLIILVVTLILVNKILKDEPDSKTDFVQNQVGAQLVNSEISNSTLIDKSNESGIEERLENILSGINGVGKTEVLITYKDSSSEIEGAIVIAEGARCNYYKTKYSFSSRSCNSDF